MHARTLTSSGSPRGLLSLNLFGAVLGKWKPMPKEETTTAAKAVNTKLKTLILDIFPT